MDISTTSPPLNNESERFVAGLLSIDDDNDRRRVVARLLIRIEAAERLIQRVKKGGAR